MKENELKRLSRAELLELLLIQTKETERLQKKLEIAEAKLTDRYLKVQNAGDLAHAVLEINGVMETAKAAAQQYLDNIIQMEKETKLRCEQMLADARKEAAQIQKPVPQLRKPIPQPKKIVPQPQKPEPQAADSDNALIKEIYNLLGEENK